MVFIKQVPTVGVGGSAQDPVEGGAGTVMEGSSLTRPAMLGQSCLDCA